MHIAELFKNRACLEDLTSELPEDIEYDRDSGCLRSARSLPDSVRWGPFCFEIVSSPQDAHLSVLTSGSQQDDVTLFVRLRVKGERWLMLLNFADSSEAASEAESDTEEATCNMAIVVNVAEQTLYLRALRCLPQGARLVARLSDSGEEDAGFSVEAPPVPPVTSSSSSLDLEPTIATAAARRRKRPASADDCQRKLQRLEEDTAHRHTNEEAPSRSEESQRDPAEDLIGSLRYCEQCGLFFTSDWMLEVHRQLHGAFEQPGQLQLAQPKPPRQPQLVLTAPVLSERGLTYVPVGLPKVPVPLAPGAVKRQLLRPQLRLRETPGESAGDNSGSISATPSSASTNRHQQHQNRQQPTETPLDLTLPRYPTTQATSSPGVPATAAAAAAAATPRMQQSRLVRIRQLFQPEPTPESQQLQIQQQQHQLQQQQLQQQQQQRKAAAVSSLMSVCKDCKIGFFNYNNYLVHRSLYCQSSRLTAAAAAAAAVAKAQQQQQPPTQPQVPPPTLPPPPPPPTVKEPPAQAEPQAAAVAVAAAAPLQDRKFQCPYCQIRFHSPSTLSAHQAFYCPENPDKVAGAASAAPATAAVEAAQEAAAITGQQQHQQQQLQALQQQQVQSPTWLPILSGECGSMSSSGSGGGYKCSICGYIGQTERGMKMHAKIHCGSVAAAAAAAACGSPISTSVGEGGGSGGGIRLPAAFPSEILSSMTPDELCMLQHKTQPYSKRRTFKRLGAGQPQQHHPGMALRQSAAARHPLVCVRCGDTFDQLELLLEHQETACASSPATVKLESIRQN